MTGQDAVVVREDKDAFLEFGDERGVVAAREVGTSDAEMEEGVAADDGLVGGNDIADASRTMTGHIAAFNFYVANMQQVVVIDFHHLEVVHIVHRKAHQRAIYLGLPQQMATLSVHGDGQLVVFAALPQAGDMVHVGVGQQDMGHLQLLLLDILRQLRILE